MELMSYNLYHTPPNKMAVQSALCALVWTKLRPCAIKLASLNHGGNLLLNKPFIYLIGPLLNVCNGGHHMNSCIIQHQTSHTFECLVVELMSTCTQMCGTISLHPNLSLWFISKITSARIARIARITSSSHSSNSRHSRILARVSSHSRCP